MTTEDMLLRQLDVLRGTSLALPIWLIGAGAVGSTIALVLSKMGFRNISIVDPDVVETHNLANQMFSKRHVGIPKVEAVQKLVKSLSPGKVHKAYHAKFQDLDIDYSNNSVIISSVDSLEARRDIWNSIAGKNFHYLDTRMGLEQGQIYFVNPADPHDYESSLEVSPTRLRCTARSIMFTPFVMAGYIGWIVKELALNSDLQPYKHWLLGIGGMSIVEAQC